MAIGIDGYNAVFRNFAQFAQRCSDGGISKAVITAEEGRPLNGRRVVSISNTLMDSVYVMRRGAEQKTANDFTRALFRDAVIDIFGGEAKIPKNVKKAMLLADYDKGKPLTARRIMAVKAEIDKATAKMRAVVDPVNDSLDASFGGNNKRIVDDASKADGKSTVTRKQLHDLAAAALTRAAHDADALDVVTASIFHLLVGGNSQFRSAEAVRKKVDAIIANMEELRAAAKGNKAIIAAGKTMIVQLNGNAIKRGVFAKMVKAVEKMKTDAIRKLSASSTSFQIHKAVAQFRDNLNNGINKHGLGTELVGGDEMQAARDFFGAAVIMKCGRSVLDKISGALSSVAASKLALLYDRIQAGEAAPGDDVSQGLRKHAAAQGLVAGAMLTMLKREADVARGVPREEFAPVEEFNGALDYGDQGLGADDVMEDMLAAGREAMKTERKAFFLGCVAGNGAGADAMREVYSRKIGPEAYKPHEMVYVDLSSNAVTLLGWNIMSGCRKLAAGDVGDSQFAKDLARDLDVNLPGGKKLSKNLDTARDELASFLTKGATTSYAALDDGGKAKVHVLMSLLSQETAKAAFDGAAIALHPDKSREAFTATGNDGGNALSMEFTLSMGDDGGVTVACGCSKGVSAITTFGENGEAKNTAVGAGSVLEAETTIKIKAAEMDRLAGLDFSKFDDAEARGLLNGTAPDKLRTIYDGFPPEYRLNLDGARCYCDFKPTLN